MQSWLRCGEENCLAIRLRTRQGCANPGIYGSVSLEAMPSSFVNDVAIQPSVERGEIRFLSDLWNLHDVQAVRIEFEITRESDPTVIEKRFSHEFHAAARKPGATELSAQVQCLDCTFAWKDARQWTYDDPVLYNVRANLYAGGALVDRSPPFRFGFREFTRRGSQLLLNGKPTHLRGHQLNLRDGSQLSAVKELKAASAKDGSCSARSTSHRATAPIRCRRNWSTTSCEALPFAAPGRRSSVLAWENRPGPWRGSSYTGIATDGRSAKASSQPMASRGSKPG